MGRDTETSKRVGRFRAEWLAEKYITKTVTTSGDIMMAMKILKPRLMAGKTGLHIFGATLAEPFAPRQHPDNINISFFIQDGLHAAGMTRHQTARHEIYHDTQELGDDHAKIFFTALSIGYSGCGASCTLDLRL
jgi:hypothetical protein